MKKILVSPAVVQITQDDSAEEKSSWTCRPDQAEKMLATFATHTEKVSAGDQSAIRDAANEFQKQRKS